MERRINGWNVWGIEQRISNSLLSSLIADQELNRIQFLKCKLGIESFVNNFFKLFIVYSVAVTLGIGKETLLLHLGFLMIRTFAYGVHAKTSSGCIFMSLCQFVGIPFFMKQAVFMPKFILMILGIFSFIILWKYAPGVTAKNKIKNDERRKKLRKKALICCIGVMLVGAILPVFSANLIITGNLLATCCVLPYFNQKGGK